ncbi:MAG: hypothetical protein KBD53_04700 [Candidatus Omnitrophica bacterium]|nr:hypothetical protein [Candidatus Omnitrophota bacterium]
MLSIIRMYTGRLINDKNFVILNFEILLFSALYGVAFRSWLIFSGMLLGASWLLNRPRGVKHTIYAMSILWGFIAFSVGRSLSWGWAVALGIFFFLIGAKAHFNSFKDFKAKDEVFVERNRVEWRRGGYFRQTNLN